ncbi:MAG: HAD-IA family hydrolase, partial [bacterium]|nr:HAD-IA family hydrolase [Candidatus Colisoma equi]
TYELTRTSKKLCAMLAAFAGDVQFYASPLTRTRMTAELIAAGMGIPNAAIPTDERLGNGSFYYENAAEVLEVFKPKNFFPACIEYFHTARQRGFRDLYAATDEFEKWIDAQWKNRLFVISTHDLYIAAFLYARKVGEFSKENWTRFLDGGAIIDGADGKRRYALVRTGLSTGVVGVRRPKISGVVFDFGGVMTNSTMPERVRRYTEKFGIDWKHLEAGFARYRRLMDGGFMTIEQMYELIWADADITLSADIRAKILEEDYASFLENYRNMRTLAWMRALKQSGFRIGILTNMPPSFAVRFRKVYPEFIALADAMVISGEERMFKPQKRIYDLLRERIGLPAEELCFIDDVESNCEGARRAGWHAVLFEGNEAVERDFRRLVG